MTGNDKRPLVPRLRFPEFRSAAAWSAPSLEDISDPVVERVGDRRLTPVSISAGIGFVPQAEKFGRDISGEQYRLYTLVRDGNFVYNKGNSLKFPQGCIYELQGWGEVAAPNVFICFQLKVGYVPGFFRACFEKNVHGLQLRKHITSGARSNGLLNISRDAFFSVRVPTPAHAEQQKISTCLSSLDERISAEASELATIKRHKSALVQQLFPADGQTVPRRRFPRFQMESVWEGKSLGEIAGISSGTTPLRSESKFHVGGIIPWVKTTDLNNSLIVRTEELITQDAKARVNPVGAVLVAMYGGFNQIGRTGLLAVPAATNQAISVLKIDESLLLPQYVLLWLNAKVSYWRRIASSSRKDPNITSVDVSKFSIAYPKKLEQERIVGCLSALDEIIAARVRKIELLKLHKKGLMQQLLPILDADTA